MTFHRLIRAITAAHIEAALAEIDQLGIPKKRRSTKWCLMRGDWRYPPKYVLALAVERGLRERLSPKEHNGGESTNKVLRDLDFKVDPHPDGSNVRET